jgi:hypothetical protein
MLRISHSWMDTKSRSPMTFYLSLNRIWKLGSLESEEQGQATNVQARESCRRVSLVWSFFSRILIFVRSFLFWSTTWLRLKPFMMFSSYMDSNSRVNLSVGTFFFLFQAEAAFCVSGWYLQLNLSADSCRLSLLVALSLLRFSYSV